MRITLASRPRLPPPAAASSPSGLLYAAAAATRRDIALVELRCVGRRGRARFIQ